MDHSPVVPASAGRLQALAATAIVLVTAASCIRGLSNEFVNWDDPTSIIGNANLRGFSGAHLKWMWTASPFAVYEPLAWMFKAGIRTVCGGAAWCFHAASIVLHCVNAVLAFFLIHRLIAAASRPGSPTGGSLPWAAAAGALFFSLHPLRVEGVAWASGLSHPLAAAFCFASTLAYLRAGAAANRRVGWLVISWVLFVAALFSKPAVVGLPFVFLLLDVYPMRRIGGERGWSGREPRRIWAEIIAFTVPAIAVSLIALSIRDLQLVQPREMSIAHRLVLSAQAAGLTLWHTIAPLNLSPFYRLPTRIEPSAALIAQLAAAAATLGIAFFGWRRWPGLACAAACFWVLMLPTLGIVRHGDQLTADRYSYLATFGIAVVLSAEVARLGATIAKLAVAATTALALMSWLQTGYWQNSESLWNRAIALDERNWVARANLASLQIEQGRIAEAKSQLAKALAEMPDFPAALISSGLIAELENRQQDALAAYRRSSELQPNGPAVVNLSRLLLGARQFGEAEELVQSALRVDPMNRSLRNNLAALYADTGRTDAAREIVATLLAEDPDDGAMAMHMGVLLARSGRPAEAQEYLDRVIKTDSSNATAYYARAGTLLARGLRGQAADDLARAVALAPNDVNACAELAALLVEQDKPAEAIELLERAHRVDPGDARVTNRLAWLLATTPDEQLRNSARAIQLATELIARLGTGDAKALDTLAAAQAANGDFAAATTTAESAVQIAKQRGDEPLASAIASRRELYRNGRPFVERQPPR